MDDIAREADIVENGFGEYVDRIKKTENSDPSDNYSYDESKRLADEYKGSGG